MNIYVSVLWALVGLLIAITGSLIWKKNLYNIPVCPKKDTFNDKDKFVEVYGKDVSFLGMMTIVASVVSFGDDKYLTAGIAINALAVVYFVLEVFHLSKRFTKE